MLEGGIRAWPLERGAGMVRDCGVGGAEIFRGMIRVGVSWGWRWGEQYLRASRIVQSLFQSTLLCRSLASWVRGAR
jgi:hypothetical protein